ncbi:MAG: hypothetical protein ACYS7Y_35035, partial [Planctomycetota bacterium]
MPSKSGTKERHKAGEARGQAFDELRPSEQAFLDLYGSFFGLGGLGPSAEERFLEQQIKDFGKGDPTFGVKGVSHPELEGLKKQLASLKAAREARAAGGGGGVPGSPGETMQLGQQRIQEMLGSLQGILDPGTAMPFGLSAPGILEGLVARSREQSALEAQGAARGASNYLPSRGGAAARGISDIFSRQAANATNVETNLRAQAAQEDLRNRLGMIGGVAGAIPSIGRAGLGPLAGLEFFRGFGDRRFGALTGLSEELMRQSMQQQQNRMAGYGALGSGLGQ